MQLPKGPLDGLFCCDIFRLMNRKDLEAKLAEVSKEFDDLETQKQQIIQRQFELRGKHQTYSEQLDDLDPAKTIVAKEKVEDDGDPK